MRISSAEVAMKNILENVWTKRAAALVSVIYAIFVFRLCYYSIFYDIHIRSRASLCVLVSAVSLLALVFMFYSRNQFLTKLTSFLILPVMLPVVLLYLGEWGLVIPILITGIVILLFSGAGEGIKTAMGTLTILFYIFGALGYFLFTSFFVSSAKETVIDKGVSPSGRYRYTVINTEDTSNGSTSVIVEPNYADVFLFNKEKPLVTFTLKNMSRVVHVERPIAKKAEISWSTQTREEITGELDKISNNITVKLSEADLKKLGYTYDQKLVLSMADLDTTDKFAIGKTAHDVDPIPLDELDDEQLAHFSIGREAGGKYYVLALPADLEDDFKKHEGRIYINTMTTRQLTAMHLIKSRSIVLNDLTDAQLEELGISDEGDVMTFNGEVCFRFYIAELENYFDVNSRKLSLDLIQ